MGDDGREQRDEEMALSLLCPLNLKGTSKYQRPDGKRGTDKKKCVCVYAGTHRDLSGPYNLWSSS